ncbi:SH3 and multiple ankyrin repeat domains protein, partial [Clonorchis sinensis]
TNLRQFLDNVKNGECDKVTKWLNKGLDPNFQWKDMGETPLTLAIKLAKPRDMIMTLVSGGAHLDYRAADTMTPLHKAAVAGNYEAIKVLLDLGQSPNTKDQYNLTPLYYAVLNDTRAVCVERLLYDHATLGTADEAGLQEIHQACRFGRVLHLETLITYGADINSQTSKNGNTPLHICAFTGQEACARLLLFRGADRRLLNRAGHTAYQQAVLSEHQAVADEIKNFQDKDVVPVRGNPKRNERRRSSSRMCLQQRSSSLGRLSDFSNDENEQNPETTPHSLTASNGHLPHSLDKARPSNTAYSVNRMTTSVSGYCLDSMALGRLDNTGDYSQFHSKIDYGNNSLSHSVYNLRTSAQSTTDNFPNYSSATMRVQSGTRYRQPSSPGPESHKYSTACTNQRNSGRPALDTIWASVGQDNGSDTASIFSSSSVRCPNSSGTYGSTASTLQLVLNGQASILDLDASNLPRMIVLQKGPRGFGFVVRGRRGVPGEFQPNLEIPALQYLEKVEPGSAADRAGLKPGDYILEVNGINVTSMSHEAVVQLIRNSGDLLGMKIITISPSESSGSVVSLDKQGRTSTWHTGNSISGIDLTDNSSVHSNTTTGTVRSQVCLRENHPLPRNSNNNPYSTISRSSQMKQEKLDPTRISEPKGRQVLPNRSTTKSPAPPPPPFQPPTPIALSSPKNHISNKDSPQQPPTIPPPPSPLIIPGQNKKDICHSPTDPTFSAFNSSLKQIPPRLSPTVPGQYSVPIPTPPAKTTESKTHTSKIPPPLFITDNTNTTTFNQKPSNGFAVSRPEVVQSALSPRDDFNEQLPLPPPPPPESPTATTNITGTSGLMLGMLRRLNNGERESKSVNNDPKPSFEDHLRRAVELRRRKLEMHSSEDDDETRSRVDADETNRNASAYSTLYSSTNVCPPRVNNGTPSNDCATPTATSLRRNLSISQTGESSFKIAAEKFHAKALARSQGNNAGTIPPPERFKDTTSNVQRLATEFNQCTQRVDDRAGRTPLELGKPNRSKNPNTNVPPVLSNKPTSSLYFTRCAEKANQTALETKRPSTQINGLLCSNAQTPTPSSTIPPPPPIFANHAIR